MLMLMERFAADSIATAFRSYLLPFRLESFGPVTVCKSDRVLYKSATDRQLEESKALMKSCSWCEFLKFFHPAAGANLDSPANPLRWIHTYFCCPVTPTMKSHARPSSCTISVLECSSQLRIRANQGGARNVHSCGST